MEDHKPRRTKRVTQKEAIPDVGNEEKAQDKIINGNWRSRAMQELANRLKNKKPRRSILFYLKSNTLAFFFKVLNALELKKIRKILKYSIRRNIIFVYCILSLFIWALLLNTLRCYIHENIKLKTEIKIKQDDVVSQEEMDMLIRQFEKAVYSK